MSQVVTAPAPYLAPPVVQTPASTYPAAGSGTAAKPQTKPQAQAKPIAQTISVPYQNTQSDAYYIAYLDGDTLVCLPTRMTMNQCITAMDTLILTGNPIINRPWGCYTYKQSNAFAIAAAMSFINLSGSGWVSKEHNHARKPEYGYTAGGHYSHFHPLNSQGNQIWNGYDVHCWYGTPTVYNKW